MRQDFTFFDVDSLMDFVTLSDRAEHEGYLAELEQLDFSEEIQARKAIRRWLLPEFEESLGHTLAGRTRVKTALRVALSRWGFMPYVPSLPGIDDQRCPHRSTQEIFVLKRQFYQWLWDELFHEPFIPIPFTDGLYERADDTFVNAPNHPEMWGGAPRYRPMTHWDMLLRTDAWRENWPPENG